MWRVEFTSEAEKHFSKLDKQTQNEIHKLLQKILKIQDPHIFCKALVGDLSGFWRYLVGKYRLICKIQKDILIVSILKIAKRDKVYN
jgi:mRNA interferase RelE/StbE